MKPVARALRVFAASIFIGPFWAQRGILTAPAMGLGR
jgi:hypothetical protein